MVMMSFLRGLLWKYFSYHQTVAPPGLAFNLSIFATATKMSPLWGLFWLYFLYHHFNCQTNDNDSQSLIKSLSFFYSPAPEERHFGKTISTNFLIAPHRGGIISLFIMVMMSFLRGLLWKYFSCHQTVAPLGLVFILSIFATATKMSPHWGLLWLYFLYFHFNCQTNYNYL